MDANKDITLRKAKRQEASSNSTNLSDNLYECAEGIEAINEEVQNNLVPVRLWIREHYTKLTKCNGTSCIHCNRKFNVYTNKLAVLHKHLVKTHPDKLAEKEKKEVKFHWIWDYFNAEEGREATCKLCKATFMYQTPYNLIQHLKKYHKISGPTSDNVIENESSSDDDMDANKDVTIRKAKRRKAYCISRNLSNSLYKCTEGTEAINEEAADNFIPVRYWIREHYTKLTRSNEATCNHCNEKFVIHISYLIILHKHLVEAHPDKLEEEQKKEIKFHWIWDYYIAKGDKQATCVRCKIIVIYHATTDLKIHLKRVHKISGPTSDNVIDNESSSDNDMDANKDITIRKEKRQKASCSSTNLSNSLNECTEGIKGFNEEEQNNLVPVRLWIRGHYTKLIRNNETRCIHCNGKFIIHINRLQPLHKHLVDAHPDKLAEKEKKEIKFHWIWDYYIVKSDRQATCKRCKVKVTYNKTTVLIRHLNSIHKISGPTSDNVIDNKSSSDDMNANKDITIRKAKRQKASCISTNLSNSLNECTEGTEAINEEAADNFIPVRYWIREHYTKLTRSNEATCNLCNEKFVIHMNYLSILHKHLVEAHPDKLAEEQKKEIKFHWIWDHYIAISDRQATCQRCNAIVIYYRITELIRHFKNIHEIAGPTSGNVTDNESSSDNDKDITIRKAKHQKASCYSTNLSNNLNECTEEIKGLNVREKNNSIPVRLWMREHYTNLTRNNRVICNHCNVKFSIHISRLQLLHKHLVEAHPDKLAEEEKKEVKFFWTWDYFTLKDCTMAICKICKATIKSKNATNLRGHLSIHKIFGPGSDNDMNNENNSDNYVDADTTIKNAKRQEDLSNSETYDIARKMEKEAANVSTDEGRFQALAAFSRESSFETVAKFFNMIGHVTKKLKSMPSPPSNYKVNDRNSLTSVHLSTSTSNIDCDTESNEFVKKKNSVSISSSTCMDPPNVSASVYHSTPTAKNNMDINDKVNEYVRNDTCTDNFEQDDIRNNISTDNSEEVDDVSRACNENILFLEDNVRVEDNTAFESQSTIGDREEEMVFWPLCPVYILWPNDYLWNY